MNKTNKILLVVLIAQGILAAITWTALHTEPDIPAPHRLLDIAADDVTRISITAMQGEKETDPIVLEKKDKEWVLASADGYPAKSDAVTDLLTLLTELEVDRPIATSPANHAPLNVADTAFDRKVTLTAGKKTISLVMGRGGGSAINVRFAGKNEVYEARGQSVWKIPSRATNFIDTSLVKVDKDKLNKVTVTRSDATLAFEKQGGTWKLIQPAADTGEAAPEQDADAIKRFVERFASLIIADVLGKEKKDAYGLAKDKAVTVRLQGGEGDDAFDITLLVGAKEEYHRYVQRADKEYVVKVSSYNLDPAVEKTAADFYKKTDTDSGDSATH